MDADQVAGTVEGSALVRQRAFASTVQAEQEELLIGWQRPALGQGREHPRKIAPGSIIAKRRDHRTVQCPQAYVEWVTNMGVVKRGVASAGVVSPS